MFELFGLTGGIACGKSTVSSMMSELGCTVIDCDAIVRTLQQPGTRTLERVFKRWPDVRRPDGSLDREKLGTIVFADRTQRQQLERIMFPPTVLCILWSIGVAWWRGAEVIILDHPLLYETKVFAYVTASNITVYVDDETQFTRLVRRNNLTEMEAQRRIAAQMPQHEKVRRSEHTINNNGSVAEARRNVESLVVELKRRARRYRWVRRVVAVVGALLVSGVAVAVCSPYLL
eukprot:PhM_4_TR18314/c0_g1_i1/m.105011